MFVLYGCIDIDIADASFPIQVKIIQTHWKQLGEDDEEKKRCKALANKDKKRYKLEMAKYQDTTYEELMDEAEAKIRMEDVPDGDKKPAAKTKKKAPSHDEDSLVESEEEVAAPVDRDTANRLRGERAAKRSRAI